MRGSISSNPKIRVGWREWLSLPELGIPAIKTKLDTGACTSALHASDLEVFEENGRLNVRFLVQPLQRRRDIKIVCVVPVYDRRTVTNSGGYREKRYLIRTMAILGGFHYPIYITLTSRSDMRFRMLLGRTAMHGKFIVDPAASYLTGRSLSKSYPKNVNKK